MPRPALRVAVALLALVAARADAQSGTRITSGTRTITGTTPVRTTPPVTTQPATVTRAAVTPVTAETTVKVVRPPLAMNSAATQDSARHARTAPTATAASVTAVTAAGTRATTARPPVSPPASSPASTPASTSTRAPAPAPTSTQDTVTRVTLKAGAVRIDRRVLEQALGSARDTIRVVRNGVPTTVTATETAVALQPGDFVFRKLGTVAVRVPPSTRVPIRPPRPTPSPTPAPAPAPEPSHDSTAQATPGKPVTPVTPVTPRPRLRFAMPYRWFTIDSSGVQRVLVPFVELLGGGMTYDVTKRVYRGEALIGVEDTLHPDAGSVPLPKQLKLQLRTLSGGTVTPRALAIGNTGLDYVPVSIEAPDSTSLRIRTGADTAGIVVPLPRRVLQLGITPAESRIAGFGLAATTLVVSLPRGVARGDTAHVAVSGASPETLALTADGAAVHLRSGMPGDSTLVTFTLDGIDAGHAIVRYAFPWQFLGASLLGIVLAGLARFLGARRKQRAGRLVRHVTMGAVPGFLVGCAAAIGLDVLGLKVTDPSSFAAVMVTTALGAWGGTRLLDSLSKVPEPAATS